jgi:HEAT repeats
MKPIRKHWAEAVLILCGMGAIGVLLTALLQPTEPPWEGASCSDDGNQECWPTICQLGPRAVPILLQKIRKGRTFQSDIGVALASLGPGAVPGLVAAFQDRNDRVRLAAVRAVASLRGDLEPQADFVTPRLIKLFRDPNIEIRYTAALALRRMGPSKVQAIPALTDALAIQDMRARGNPAQIQQVAAHVLGKIGPDASGAIPVLTRMLKHPSSNVGQEAAVALWRITHDTNLIEGELSRMLDDTNVTARIAALAAMRRIRRETTLAPCLIEKAEALPARTNMGVPQAPVSRTDDP